MLSLVIGAFALANRGGANSQADAETAKVMASFIVKAGNDLRSSVDRISLDRDITRMDLAATGAAPGRFGLYDPTIGVAAQALVPAKAMSTNVDTAFSLDRTNVQIVGIGTGGANALAAVALLPDLTTTTCRMVNKLVHNDSVDADPPTVGAGVAITRLEGCATINSKLTYYRVLGPAA